MHPRALYFSAVAHDRLGDRERARERLDALLALWARADRDVPLLAEARALQRKLSGGAVAERRGAP